MPTPVNEITSFSDNIHRFFLDAVAAAIDKVITPFGFQLQDFGAKNYLVPVPGLANSTGMDAVMFVLKKTTPSSD